MDGCHHGHGAIRHHRWFLWVGRGRSLAAPAGRFSGGVLLARYRCVGRAHSVGFGKKLTRGGD